MPWGLVFPDKELARCSHRLRGLGGRRRQARLGFHGATIRWLGAHDYGSRLIDQWQDQPDRRHLDVREDIDLYGLFASAVSVIECLAFAAYALGAIRNRSAFPMQSDADMREVTLGHASRAFSGMYPGSPLASALSRANASTGLRGIREARNVLAHRATDQRSVVIDEAGTRRLWTLSAVRGDVDTVELVPSYLHAIMQITGGHASRIGCGLDAFTAEHSQSHD